MNILFPSTITKRERMHVIFLFLYAVLEYLHRLESIDAHQPRIFSSSYLEGTVLKGCDVGCIPFLEGSNAITTHQDVSHVIEHPRLYELFTSIFHGTKPLTFDYKWLRGMHHGGNTGCHLDRVYMNRGSPELLTCWIPFDDLTLDMSVLAVLEGSHNMKSSGDLSNPDSESENDFYTKLQQTYGNLDVDKDTFQGTGWFTEDPIEFYHLHKRMEEKNIDHGVSSTVNPIWKITGNFLTV